MSQEEIEAGDLNAVAAALSSLSPSTGRLDRDRLMFLAGEAAARSSLAQSNSAMPRLAMSNPPRVHSAMSHELPPRLAARRWIWPAAFSTMSAVAATLLAVLLARPEPRIIERVVRLPAEPWVVVEAPAGGDVVPADASEHRDRVGQIEWDRPERPAHDRRTGDGDYLSLRDRVLARGLESWPSDRSANNAAPPETTHNHRELLESVLKSL